MKAGTLRHRVTIEKPTRTQLTGKGYTTIWNKIPGGDVWAEVRPLSSSDRFAQAHVSNSQTHIVRIRKIDDVASDMRVKFGSRYFAIQGITNRDERGIELELSCEEVDMRNTSS